MDCQEAQKRMMDFVKCRMDDDDLGDFLDHIETCRDCYEELQINYCVYEGIKMLDDEDSRDSFNIQQALDNYIRQSKEKLRRKRRWRKILLMCVVVIAVLLLVGLLLYSGMELPHLF